MILTGCRRKVKHLGEHLGKHRSRITGIFLLLDRFHLTFTQQSFKFGRSKIVRKMTYPVDKSFYPIDKSFYHPSYKPLHFIQMTPSKLDADRYPHSIHYKVLHELCGD